jgi:hypothetical protein
MNQYTIAILFLLWALIAGLFLSVIYSILKGGEKNG